MGKAKRFLGSQLPRSDRLNKSQSRQSNTLRSQNITPAIKLKGTPNNEFVKSTGGLHIGPVGYISDAINIASGILDLTKNVAGDIVKVRKNINVNPETGTTDTLDLISTGGTEFLGQELRLIGQSGDTITITHDSGSAAGNNKAILCPNDTNYTITNDNTVTLFYDDAVGKWSIDGDSVAGGAGGASFPLDYPVDRQGNKTGTVTHDLALTTGHKLVFTATGDCDITISNIPTTAADAQDFYIEVIQDGTGGHAITANDSEWVNFPTLSTTADTTSLIAVHADGDGNMRAVTLLNATATTSGATKALDNLVSPTLNVDIDVNTKNLTGIDELTFTASAGTTAAQYGIAVNAGNTALQFNVPSTKEFEFLENNVVVWGMDGDQLTGGDIILSDTFTINDSVADPIVNGMFTRNGNDVKVYTGGGVVNLSTIGAQTPWTSNIDADGFDLQDFGDISFTNGHTLTSTGALMLIDLSASTDDFQLEFGDSTKNTAFSNNQAAFTSDTASFNLATQYSPTTPADSDVFATMDFGFKNSTGTLETWGSMVFTAQDVTNGTEDSKFELNLFDSGTLVNPLTINGLTSRFEINGMDLDVNNSTIRGIADFSLNSTPTVSGATVEAALTDLLAELETLGLIIDSHTY